MVVQTTSLILRNGTTTQLLNFTGEKDEIVVDTTKRVVVISNGEMGKHTWGAREDLSTTDVKFILDKGVADSKLSNVSETDLKNKGIALANGTNFDLTYLYQNGVAKNDASNITQATTSVTGVTRFATAAEVVNSNRDDIAISPNTLKTFMTATSRTFSPMYISGLNPTWVDESTIRITTGSCRTQDDSMNVVINSPITLTLGTKTANTTYHAFIGCNDQGATIAQFFTTIVPQSLIDSGYKHYRRLCSIQTDSESNIRKFVKAADTMYFEKPIALPAVTSKYSEIKVPTPKDIEVTPIIEIIPETSYSLGMPGLQESGAIDLSTQGVINCFVCTNTLMAKGNGTAQLIGYVDTRQQM